MQLSVSQFIKNWMQIAGRLIKIMHIHTIVKVHANTAEEAIKKVKELVNHEYEMLPAPFDWFDEDAIRVSPDVKIEKDFEALREAELKEYKVNLKKALKMSDKNVMKGYYLTLAGEGLNTGQFWSPERYAYDYDCDYGSEGKNIYYIKTDRHF
jgi:hypothetical protein